ncbi:unknown [Clostridium sp. CAG:1013]|nr:unknown [Clostridium sp. CAG:1013]
MPQAVNVQVQGQAMLLQDQFKPPGEGAGGHGQVGSVTAEDVVLCGQLSTLVEFQLPLAEGAVLFQETGHLQGEVHVPVPGSGLGLFYNDVLSRDLHHVAADVDGLLRKVYVLPFQATALAPAHPRGDDEFEISFVLDTLFLQRGNEFPCGFFVGHVALLFLLAAVFVGAPGRILR